jgi:integrase
VLPINDDLAHVLGEHLTWFIDRFGGPQPRHYLFPWGRPDPSDPTRHTTELKRGWSELRARTGISCRLHDMRHTYATKLAENGVPESTMLALMGHMSRAMLERYSHIRMAAKRKAAAGVRLRPEVPNSAGGVPVKVPVVETPARVQ